jgi:hypothetical protein
MSGTISFNPYLTNQPANSFLAPTQGYVSGTALDDPSVRMELMGGTVNTGESIVMWGGVPISETINQTGTGSDLLGPTLKRATSTANTTGFSVFNQAGSMVQVPGASVPVAAVGNYIPFFRLYSGIRLVVNCDPAIVAAITAGTTLINTEVLYWDVTNYRITLVTSGGNWALPTHIQLLSTNTNSKTVAYASSAATWTTGDAAVILI